MSQSNKRVLQEANAAIAQGNIEGFLKFCTADTRWTFVGDRTISGKDALREWMKTAYRNPPRFEVHRLIAEDEFVTALGEITLTDESGKVTHHAYCDVWRFRDGLMAELQAFVIETASS